MSRNFGIEIECININENRAVEVLLAAGINVSTNTGYRHSDYTQWKVIHDASVPGGCEVVSPILNGETGFAEIKQVCKTLSDAGATVNRTCGLHVHVDASGMTGEWVRNIVKRYSKFESNIDNFMPVSRRARNNQRYCDSVINMVQYLESDSPSRWNSPDIVTVCSAARNRFYKINLTSYVRYNTIEFRHHSGSVNGNKITNWVNFVLAFIEASKPEHVVVSNGPYEGRRRGRPRNSCREPVTPVLSATGEPVIANVYNLTSLRARKVFNYLRANVGNWCNKADLASSIGVDIDSIPAYVSQIRNVLGVQIINSRQNGYSLVSLNVVRTLASQTPVVTHIPTPSPEIVDDEWTRGIPAYLISYYAERAMELNGER